MLRSTPGGVPSTKEEGMRVLLVEDDDLIAHGIQAGLHAHGLTVDGVRTAAQAAAMLSAVHYQVVILDLGLPDEDGMSLLQRWRAVSTSTGRAMPSARQRCSRLMASSSGRPRSRITTW
jgi:DNA-binding response OmpR family regulator